MRAGLVALMVGVLLIASVTMAPTASANHTYVGAADATGFRLTITGEGLIFGSSHASLASTSPAPGCVEGALSCAIGGGAPGASETVTAMRPGDMGPNTGNAGTTEGTDLAQVAGGTFAPAVAQVTDVPDPTAAARGVGAELDVTINRALGDVPAGDVIDDVVEGLQPILDPVGEVDPALEDTVSAIEEFLQGLDELPLASVGVAPADTTVNDIASRTTAIARSGGAVLTLGPSAIDTPVTPDGLAVVEIGAATATATTDQRRGIADFDAAVATLTLAGMDPIAVESGEGRQCLSNNGAPAELTSQLDLCVTAGGGDLARPVDGQPGAAAARASGATVEILAQGEPLLVLGLADVTAGVNAAPPAQVVPTPRPSPTRPPPRRDLPRTGGSNALPAVLLLAMGTTAGIVVLGKRR